MSKWEEQKFGDLYLIPSRNGLTRPSSVRGAGYKFINMGEIFAYNRIGNIETELVQLNEKEKEEMTLQKNDLLFARQSLVFTGAGKCSIMLDLEDVVSFESHIIFDSFIYIVKKSSSCRPITIYIDRNRIFVDRCIID